MWHYQTVHTIEGGQDTYSVQEVHYLGDRIVVSEEGRCVPYGESKEELLEDLRMMLSDCEKHSVKER